MTFDCWKEKQLDCTQTPNCQTWPGRTRQPYFEGVEYRVSGELPNTDITMNQTLWLGIYPGLNQEHLDFVAEKLEEFFGVNF